MIYYICMLTKFEVVRVIHEELVNTYSLIGKVLFLLRSSFLFVCLVFFLSSLKTKPDK
jgi:hypothetical protein